MKAITLTHNDLDGLGSLIMLILKFQPTKHFFMNYWDIDKVVNNIIAYKHENPDVDTLLIADLSFSDNKPYLEKLVHLFENNIFYVDHHQYPENFWDEFSFKHIIDPSQCATKTLYERVKIKDAIKKPEYKEALDTFVHYVDTWDCWRDTNPDFEMALYYSELFNSLKTTNESLIKIAKDLLINKFSIFNHIEDFKKVYLNGYQAFKDTLVKDKLLWTYEDLAFALTWDFLPKLELDLYRQGTGIIVAVQHGIFKVRINQHKNYRLDDIKRLKLELTGKQDFCHPYAFTYATNYTQPEQIVKEFDKIKNFWINTDVPF